MFPYPRNESLSSADGEIVAREIWSRPDLRQPSTWSVALVEVSSRELLHPFVPLLSRFCEQLAHLTLERRVTPVEAGRGLSAHRVALIGATQQDPRGGQGKCRVAALGEWVLAEGVSAPGIFVDERPGHAGKDKSR